MNATSSARTAQSAVSDSRRRPRRAPIFPQPPPDEPPRRRKRAKHRHRRVWLYVFALIGVAFVAVEIFRYLIVPLLVQLHIWTGGRL